VLVTYEEGKEKFESGVFEGPLILPAGSSSGQGLGFGSLLLRGLPVHLPAGEISTASVWDGFYELDGYLARHSYRLSGLTKRAGLTVAEVGYRITFIPKEDGGSTNSARIQGEGRVVLDIAKGSVISNVWEIRGGGKEFDYALAALF